MNWHAPHVGHAQSGQLELVLGQLAAPDRCPHLPHLIGHDVVRGIQLGPARHVHRGQIAASGRHKLCRDRLVVARRSAPSRRADGLGASPCGYLDGSPDRIVTAQVEPGSSG